MGRGIILKHRLLRDGMVVGGGWVRLIPNFAIDPHMGYTQ